MKKFWLIFIFAFLKLSSQTFSINGKVTDENNNPLQNISVSLIKQKDSAIINFLGTSNSGNFNLKIPQQNEPSFLQISGDKLKTYSRKFESIHQNESLGTIKLNKELVTNIEEVQITVAPVKFKKDTVEYNTSYLKVKPDSKIDELINELPGAEIDADGKITINGKSVSKIHINGKPMFDKNGKTELETISADIIKKIQVTTSKTKEEELTGRMPTADSLTLNFEMDKKNRRGIMTNFRFGYGSDKRYAGALSITKINQDSRLAFTAGSNNINAGLTGKTGAGTGIFRTSIINLSYSDKLDNLDLEKLGINYYERNTETYSKSARTTFLPDYKLDRNTERSGNKDLRRLGVNGNGVLKLDKFTNLIFSSNFNNNTTEGTSDNQSTTLRDDILLNSSLGSVKQKSITNNFSQSLGITKKFQKERRNLTASVASNFMENSSTDYNLTTTIFHQSPEDNDYRNQRSLSKIQNTDFSFNTKYHEPISDSAIVTTEIAYKYSSLTNDRKVNDFDLSTEEYSRYNSLLSNRIDQSINSLNTVIGYDLNKTKFRFFFNALLDFNTNDFYSLFSNDHINFKRNFFFPNYETRFTYRFSNSKSLELYNQSDFTAPTMSALNPYTDISNPLVTTQGNPNLKSTWKNTSSVYFVSRNLPKNITYSTSLKFSYTDNNISDLSSYDDTGRRFQTYTNISGNKSLNWDNRFSKIYKWVKNEFRLSPSFSTSYTHRQGFVDGLQYTNTIYSFSPKMTLRLNLKEILDLTSSANLNYNFSNYTNYRVDKTRAAQQNYSFRIINYFLKSSLYFSNDINVTKNNNISAGFNRTSYFWNTGVNYKFYKKQMTLQFNINDILNQRQNAIRNIGDNYIEDREELVLRRYFMLTLILDINKFGGNKS